MLSEPPKHCIPRLDPVLQIKAQKCREAIQVLYGVAQLLCEIIQLLIEHFLALVQHLWKNSQDPTQHCILHPSFQKVVKPLLQEILGAVCCEGSQTSNKLQNCPRYNSHTIFLHSQIHQ